MEASALQAPAVVSRNRAHLGPLLRLRSDEQLVALFRAGHDEAFRVIHDRYRQRLFAYTRQMLPGRQDAEDALQDVFVRAYANLRASNRQLALRAWLYRVAHNRCVDELRRPLPPPPEAMQFICAPIQDPIAQADQRESLRRLVTDVRRLPDQQRSALLMREMEGLSYADLAEALGVSVAAVKSLLVRARMALALAMEARETACGEIREHLILAHDRRVRPGATARRHLRDCPGCSQFRRELRGMSRQLGALVPAIGPLGMLAKLLGGGAGGGAAASGGGVVLGGATGGGAVASAGALASGAGHVATLIAATVVTAGGAVEIQGTISRPAHRHLAHHARVFSPAAPSSIALGSAGAPIGAYPPVAKAAAAIADAVVERPANTDASGSGLTATSPGSPVAAAAETNLAVLGTGGPDTTASSGSATPLNPPGTGPGTWLPSLAASAIQPPSAPTVDSTTPATSPADAANATTAGTPGTSGGTTGSQTATTGGATMTGNRATMTGSSATVTGGPATATGGGRTVTGGGRAVTGGGRTVTGGRGATSGGHRGRGGSRSGGTGAHSSTTGSGTQSSPSAGAASAPASGSAGAAGSNGSTTSASTSGPTTTSGR